MQIDFIKTVSGQWIPATEQDREFTAKKKAGVQIHADWKERRNPKFHNKFFAMLNTGFQYWEPGEIDCKYGTPQKNFDQFRKDVIILAGFYTINHRLDGTFRVEAKSISFGRMEEQEFVKVYQAVLTVLLDNVFTGWDIGDVENTIQKNEVNALLEYA